MKTNLYLFFVLSLFFMACKKEGKVKKNSSIAFSVQEINIPAQAGKTEFTIKWSYTEWEITTDPNGFISDFTYLKGGSWTTVALHELISIIPIIVSPKSGSKKLY